MRRLHALWAVAGSAALLAGAVAPSAAAPTPSPDAPSGTAQGSTRTVTLITGDTVSLTAGPDGKSAVDARPGKGREGVNFVTTEQKGEVSVVPDDAIPLVQAGRLDPALFNVSQLVKQGYADEKTGAIPLIATYRKGTETPEGALRTRALPGIGGAALSAKKSTTATTFWADIAPAPDTPPTAKAARQLGDGLDKLWLDAKVSASLDVSVPQIGAPDVWKAGFDGKGVKIAVLDTGVDTGHPDLAGKIAESQSFVPDEGIQDGFGHGTHVASTIVGSGAASGGRYKGVAPGAELAIGKVLDDTGHGQESWIIAGMEWAADSGAKIVSMSLGGTASGPSDPLSETVDRLSTSTGTLFVIAAGNAGPSDQTVGTPGIADSALTVGAVDKSDKLASFSSRGPRLGDSAVKPEITAPGVNITAARAAGTTMGTPVDDEYTTASGTSMATPHVAGAAALVAQAHPDWTGEQIRADLASTAKTQPDADVYQQGDGRVDAVRAVGQGVFATPTLSFGKFEDGGTEADSKDITYTNTTDNAVELKLASTLTAAALGADTVTVPAKGSATVAVKVDPAGQAQGRYTGHITASADGVLVTTGVGFEKLPKTYDLKVSLVGRDGKPSTSASIYMLQELNGAYPDTYGFIGSGWTFQVPAGTYSTAAWIPGRDAGGLEVNTSVVGDPEIKVDKDTEVVLDARKAVEIKPKTKENSEFRGFSTNWHREGPGSAWGLTYSQGFWTDHIYVAPTEKVTEGTFEFSSKFRLYAKELTARVTSPEKYALPLDYAQTSTGFPMKISGDHTVRAVDAGGGTAADFAGLDVRGKAAVVGLGAGDTPDEALANATKAGATYVIAYRKTPGYWIASVKSATIPLMIATGEDGAGLAGLLGTGRTVKLRLDGTPVSPYVYTVMFPQTGAVSQNQTYPLDSSTTVRQTVRYHGNRAGQIAKDTVYRYRPRQSADIETANEVQLGTVRTEYYNVSADTRIWHAVYPDWQANRPQWNSVRTFTEAGKLPAEDWLRQVVRPATSGQYGLSARTGDKLTFRIPELSDETVGHYASVDGVQDTAKGTLYADGQLVGDTTLGGYGAFGVPAAKGAYRFVLDTRHTTDWATYSTSTHTEWTFSSAHTDKETALPVLSLGYDLDGLDLLNRAGAGRTSELSLTVRNQEGRVTPSALKAWVSYDDGSSWKEVRVKHGKAEIRHPKGARFVSLRVLTSDAVGNQVDQTVLRAYGLK
ncbi:S8 family serine peptidase [Streptomyces sp. NBC_01728]|uniref:S8 family serine peptidase n=1 Tax=unclassified Streptomyces TaxID=2593676 RepID=UPI00224C80DE|nr:MULTISPECIES: S8 family serine peptidase [unclassified Streptomyces]MCX4457557.1 S8 family serine peptidase [Streptomyces sp. NBC_01719]MCX4496914.1 S8 family serine peptidase [Streptomyces sp. NBC_01728]